MTCIDSELLCLLLFKCPFSVWHPQGEISPLWSALSYSKPWLLWISWNIPRKSSHVLMMERGELWSYGALVMGVIKIDSNALVYGSCGAFFRLAVPQWSSSMQSLRAPAGGGKVLKCCSCEYEYDKFEVMSHPGVTATVTSGFFTWRLRNETLNESETYCLPTQGFAVQRSIIVIIKMTNIIIQLV